MNEELYILIINIFEVQKSTNQVQFKSNIKNIRLIARNFRRRLYAYCLFKRKQ